MPRSRRRALVAALAERGPVAIVDPHGAAAGFAEIFGLDRVDIAGVFRAGRARVGAAVLGGRAAPLTELAANAGAPACLRRRIRRRAADRAAAAYVPAGALASAASMRCGCPAERLTNRRRYLDPLNFATNFAFFRDTGGAAYAARDGELLGRLRRGRRHAAG